MKEWDSHPNAAKGCDPAFLRRGPRGRELRGPRSQYLWEAKFLAGNLEAHAPPCSLKTLQPWLTLQPQRLRGREPGDPSKPHLAPALLGDNCCFKPLDFGVTERQSMAIRSTFSVLSYHCHPSRFSLTSHRSKYLRNKMLPWLVVFSG